MGCSPEATWLAMSHEFSCTLPGGNFHEKFENGEVDGNMPKMNMYLGGWGGGNPKAEDKEYKYLN